MVNIIGADRFNGHDEAYESGYFTVKLIKAATQNFNPANRICELVRIYKGVLPYRLKITMKNIDEHASYEFENEIIVLSTLKHSNLRKMLNWGTKMRIFLGIENGLAFLHHKEIVQRDIRLYNIFLDNFLDPKISYLGLAKHFGDDDTHCSTSRIMGAQ
ncbi:hypothetical protein MKX01_031864 [Papaver californicum]|nr:hypothetical protein MKX01_031864 [Papaver californicum]